MRRGDLYRVDHPSRTDPKRSRVFVVVSRQVLCDTVEYSTVICAPVSSSRHGLATQVPVGEAEGLKHASAIHCDGLRTTHNGVAEWIDPQVPFVWCDVEWPRNAAGGR